MYCCHVFCDIWHVLLKCRQDPCHVWLVVWCIVRCGDAVLVCLVSNSGRAVICSPQLGNVTQYNLNGYQGSQVVEVVPNTLKQVCSCAAACAVSHYSAAPCATVHVVDARCSYKVHNHELLASLVCVVRGYAVAMYVLHSSLRPCVRVCGAWHTDLGEVCCGHDDVCVCARHGAAAGHD